jgi:hypothetical protein
MDQIFGGLFGELSFGSFFGAMEKRLLGPKDKGVSGVISL